MHFCAVASSATAGAAIVTEAAFSAAALVIVRKLFLVERPFLLKCRMLVPPLQRQTYSGPGWSRICSFSLHSDDAEYCNGRNKRNQASEPQARQFNSLSDRKRCDRVGA